MAAKLVTMIKTYPHDVGIDVVEIVPLEDDAAVVVGIHIPVPVQRLVPQPPRLIERIRILATLPADLLRTTINSFNKRTTTHSMIATLAQYKQCTYLVHAGPSVFVRHPDVFFFNVVCSFVVPVAHSATISVDTNNRKNRAGCRAESVRRVKQDRLSG